MASLISQETFISIKSLSKDYKITSNSSNPKKNKQLLRHQLSEILKKSPCEENTEMAESLKSWIKSLMMPSLLNVFSTHNPLICSFLIHMNLKINSEGDFEFALMEGSDKKTLEEFDLKKLFYFRKRSRKRRDEKFTAEQELEKSLRFMDTDEYLDTLSLESTLLRNPDRVFRFFDIVSGGKAFKVPCRAYWDNSLKKWFHEYPNWQNPTTFHSLVEWACACLERGVWIKYFHINGIDPRYEGETTPYSYCESVLASVDSLITLPSFFREIPKSVKEELIGDIGSLTQAFQEVKQKLSNNKNTGYVPSYSNFYSCNVDNTRNYQNSKSVELILQMLKNFSEEIFIEYLISSSLDRTATIFDLTTRIIALRIKELHTEKIAEELMSQESHQSAVEKKKHKKKKKKKNSKTKNKEQKNKHLEDEASKIVSEDLLQKVMSEMYQYIEEKKQEETQNEDPKFFLDCESENDSKKVQESVPDGFPSENEFQVVNQKKKKTRRFQPQQKIRGYPNEKVQHSTKHIDAEKPHNSQVIDTTKNERPAKFLWERSEIVPATSNLNITEFPPLSVFTPVPQNQGTLHQEIIQFVEQTTSKIQKKMSFVGIIIEKITMIVSELFSGNIQLYGSYATGLAIESSDIDIAVMGVKFESREELQNACIQLGQFLEILPFVVSCKKIITATVPVIKLEAESLGSTNKVMIDITFTNPSEPLHLGLEAISFTKDLLILLPHIKFLAIVLKHFLYSNNLNSVYHGGLNSYSLVLWITASLNSMPVVPDDLGTLLIYFLDFFGNKFNPKATGVNIINRESLFPLTNSTEHAVTVDPVNHNNNTTRSSYRINEVLKAFSVVHNRIQEIINKGKNRNMLKLAFKKVCN